MKYITMLGVFAIAFALPFTAGATVKKEGTWPTSEKKVDLEFDGKPSEGLKKLAEEAGWSLVISNAVGVDGNGSNGTNGDDANVHVNVDSQPADAVLEALFMGHDVVAMRNGTLITVMPATAAGATPAIAPIVPTPPILPATPTTPAPPPVASVTAPSAVPPVPTVRGEDRNVFGGNLTIGKDEIVHTVTVAGGSLRVEGTVTGDLVVAGGSARVVRGARVVGNATAFGGSLRIENGARVDGDVGVAGGSLKREEGSIIGGNVVDNKHQHGRIKVNAGRDGVSNEVEPTTTESADGDDGNGRKRSSGRARLSEAVRDFGNSMTKMSLLFVLGCVLLALLAPRMERVRIEIASRPMRSFALGLVGSLAALIGGTILLTVLCITVIGIPVAVVGILFAILAVYGAIASVLTTVGAALIQHKTQNPYFHLLIGCAVFLVISSIPWIGGLATLAVTMIAIGALFTTKVGGLLERKKKTSPPSMGLV